MIIIYADLQWSSQSKKKNVTRLKTNSSEPPRPGEFYFKIIKTQPLIGCNLQQFTIRKIPKTGRKLSQATPVPLTVISKPRSRLADSNHGAATDSNRPKPSSQLTHLSTVITVEKTSTPSPQETVQTTISNSIK